MDIHSKEMNNKYNIFSICFIPKEAYSNSSNISTIYISTMCNNYILTTTSHAVYQSFNMGVKNGIPPIDNLGHVVGLVAAGLVRTVGHVEGKHCHL